MVADTQRADEFADADTDREEKEQRLRETGEEDVPHASVRKRVAFDQPPLASTPADDGERLEKRHALSRFV